jgi:hypothetical protein
MGGTYNQDLRTMIDYVAAVGTTEAVTPALPWRWPVARASTSRRRNYAAWAWMVSYR